MTKIEKKEYIKNEDETKKTILRNDTGWVEQLDSEFIKLKIGEPIEGFLVEKNQSEKYDCGIYQIKVDNENVPKTIFGTKMLDRKMKSIDIGTEIKIERVSDKPTNKGNSMHVFKVFIKHEGEQ